MSILAALRLNHNAASCWQRIQPIVRDALLHCTAPPPHEMALAFRSAFLLCNCRAVDNFPSEWSAALLPAANVNNNNNNNNNNSSGSNDSSTSTKYGKYRGGGPGLILLQTLLVHELREFFFSASGPWQALHHATLNLRTDPRLCVVEYVARHKGLLHSIAILEAILPSAGWYVTSELEAMAASSASAAAARNNGGSSWSYWQQQQHPQQLPTALQYPPPAYLAPITLREVVLREWCDLVVHEHHKMLFDAGSWLMHKIRRHHHRPAKSNNDARQKQVKRPTPEEEAHQEDERCLLVCDFLQALRELSGCENRTQMHIHHSSMQQVADALQMQGPAVASGALPPVASVRLGNQNGGSTPLFPSTVFPSTSNDNNNNNNHNNNNPFRLMDSGTGTPATIAGAVPASPTMSMFMGSAATSFGSAIGSANHTPTPFPAFGGGGGGGQQNNSNNNSNMNNTPPFFPSSSAAAAGGGTTPQQQALPAQSGVSRQPPPPQCYYALFKPLGQHACTISFGQFLELQTNKMKMAKNTCTTKSAECTQSAEHKLERLQQQQNQQQQQQQQTNHHFAVAAAALSARKDEVAAASAMVRQQLADLLQQYHSTYIEAIMSTVRMIVAEMARERERNWRIFGDVVQLRDFRREMSALLDKHCTMHIVPVYSGKMKTRDAASVAVLFELATKNHSAALVKHFHAQLSTSAFQDASKIVKELRDAIVALRIASSSFSSLPSLPLIAQSSSSPLRAAFASLIEEDAAFQQQRDKMLEIGCRFATRFAGLVFELEKLCRDSAKGDGSALLAIDCGIVAALTSSSTNSVSKNNSYGLPASRIIIAVLLAFLSGQVLRGNVTFSTPQPAAAVRDSENDDDDDEDDDRKTTTATASSPSSTSNSFDQDCKVLATIYRYLPDKDIFCSEYLAGMANRAVAQSSNKYLPSSSPSPSPSTPPLQQQQNQNQQRERRLLNALCRGDPFGSKELCHKMQLLEQDAKRGAEMHLQLMMMMNQQQQQREPQKEPQTATITVTLLSQLLAPRAAASGNNQQQQKHHQAVQLFLSAVVPRLSDITAAYAKNFGAVVNSLHPKWTLNWPSAISRVKITVHFTHRSGGNDHDGDDATISENAAVSPVTISVTSLQAGVLLALESSSNRSSALEDFIGGKNGDVSKKLLLRDLLPLQRAGLVAVSDAVADASSSPPSSHWLRLASSEQCHATLTAMVAANTWKKQMRNSFPSSAVADLFSETVDPTPSLLVPWPGTAAASTKKRLNNNNDNNNNNNNTSLAVERRNRPIDDEEDDDDEGNDSAQDGAAVNERGDITRQQHQRADAAASGSSSLAELDNAATSATSSPLTPVLQNRSIAIQAAVMQALKRSGAAMSLLEIMESLRSNNYNNKVRATDDNDNGASSPPAASAASSSSSSESPLAMLTQRFGFAPSVLDIQAQLDFLTHRSYVRHTKRTVGVASDETNEEVTGEVDVYTYEP